MKRDKKKKEVVRYKKGHVIQCYTAIMPQIIGFFIFSLYPIIWVFGKSFTDYDGMSGTVIGLANYIRVFVKDKTFWMSMANTGILTVMKLVMEIPLAFTLAMLLCKKNLRGKRIFNIMLFLPSVIGVATAAMLFAYMFRSYNGVINNLLESLNLISEPISWLGNKWTALFVIALMSTWSTFPINMMYFMGAISGVSQEVYESAELDGCTGIKKIFYITLPMIAPTFKVILMLALVGTMKIMNEVMLLTKGGPSGQTNVVMLHIYNMFFGVGTSGDPLYAKTEIGYASACSIIVSIVIGIITAIYLKYTKKADELY